MSSLVSLHLHFHLQFFADSQVLLTGFQKLIFSNGLDYATTASTAPSHISCWHFVSSLDTHPEGHLLHDGLTSPQLAQVLINYQICFEQIFANCCNYTWIPQPHASPITWQGTYHGRLVLAICHLLLLETIAVWNEHRQSPSNQGRHLMVAFLHHLGMLMCIFEDWLNISKCDGQYCQPFIAFDPAAKNSTDTKTRYVLATKKSAEVKFVDTFEEWKVHFTTTFGPTAIHSG